MESQGMSFTMYIERIVPETIGFKRLFRHVTNRYNQALEKRFCFEDDSDNYENSGMEEVQFHADFDETGKATLAGEEVGSVELLSRSTEFANKTDVLKRIGKVIEYEVADPMSLSPSKYRLEDLQRENNEDKRIFRKSRLISIGQELLTIGKNETVSEPIKMLFRKREIPIDDIAPRCLKFHPNLPAYEREGEDFKFIGKYPAGVFAVSNPEGKLISFLTLFTTSNGRAPMGLKSKAQLVSEEVKGRWLMGSAVRMYNDIDSTKVHICVDVMVAQSLRLQLGAGHNIWAVNDADQLASFIPPEWCTSVTVWSKYEPAERSQSWEKMSIMNASIKLRRRVRDTGRSCFVRLPYVGDALDESWDWEDVIIHHRLHDKRVKDRPCLEHFCASDHVVNQYASSIEA